MSSVFFIHVKSTDSKWFQQLVEFSRRRNPDDESDRLQFYAFISATDNFAQMTSLAWDRKNQVVNPKTISKALRMVFFASNPLPKLQLQPKIR